MLKQVIYIKSKQEMEILAKKIADNILIGDVILLKGNLGAGKSFFAKNFINHLKNDGVDNVNVLSPTFNLVYSYDTKKGEVFHFDLYRLKNAQELENIGFFDNIKSGISLIEWPEIADKFLPKNAIKISIKADEINLEENARFVTIENYPHNISL